MCSFICAFICTPAFQDFGNFSLENMLNPHPRKNYYMNSDLNPKSFIVLIDSPSV